MATQIEANLAKVFGGTRLRFRTRRPRPMLGGKKEFEQEQATWFEHPI
jgi:hypothetical protein